ncbi:hypothetical protein L6164_001272 [Bauhinia variegata]|uniref:Uncharacterized protein n=1 Tax=Bauhinia variegata TaxID=167791 RepID=A0ACB9Q9K6_BAUVA|nr:hypothetical protein L6164_001272 [Bauhinia variegata]
MEFLSLAVGKLLDSTVAPLARQMGYMISYSSNVKELKKEAEALRHTREHVQHRVDAALRNGEMIEEDVRKWLEEVDDIALKAHELNNDERHAKTGWSSRSFPNMRSRNKLSRHSKKMKEEIEQIKLRGNFNEVSYRDVPKFTALSSSIIDSTQLASRVSLQNDLMRALENPNVQTIGVHGLPGVGKTTLVKEVAEKVQKDKLFDAVIFANVTQDPDLGKIQQQIADMLGLKFEEQTLIVRAERLRNRLSLNQQALLIILDDLWEELNMDEVGIPSVEQHKHLKILMTSRSREVLSDQMYAQKNFLLPVLPKREAWKLFMDKAHFEESAVSDEFRLIAEHVTEECAGLPIAIVAIASALRNKSLLEWKDVLRQLQNLASANITGTQDRMYKSIEVSYEKLENDLLKSIFLLCGVMRSHSLVMDLFTNSIGLGLFQDIYNMEEAQNSLHISIRKLKDSCLLLDSYSSKRFNMHDVVRDTAIRLASRQQNLFIKRYEKLEEWPERDQMIDCRTIILDCCDIDELPQGLYFRKLIFFHLHNSKPNWDVTDSMFTGMGELKVLNLTGEPVNSLPSSISLLSNLRTLCLDVIGDIGIIGELKGLKVLTLSSDMLQLPSQLSQLTHLKLLDLRGCYNLVLIPPNILSRLTKLQELYMATHIYSNPIEWYVDDPNYEQESMRYVSPSEYREPIPNNVRTRASLAELKNLAHLTSLELRIHNVKMLPKDTVFDRLRRFKLIIGRTEPNLSSEYEASRILELDLGTSIHSWDNVKRLLDHVDDLHLYNLAGAENVVPGTNKKGMPKLRYLHLQFIDEIQTIVDSSWCNHAIDIFPNLESLVINCAGNMKKLCNGPLTRGSFSRLKVINVANCNQVKTLFSVSTIRGPPQSSLRTETISDNENAASVLQFAKLQTIILKDLPQLISFWEEHKTSSTDMDAKVVTGDNIAHTPISLFTEKVTLPNLEEIVISNVLKLNTIWHLQQQLRPNSFDNLRKLQIENCPGIRTIFPSAIGSSMHNLETLFIKNCESLEHVFDLQVLYDKEVHSGISGLSRMFSFPNLQQVYVERCEKLKYLFPRYVARTLDKLQRLKIEKCSLMEEIITKKDNSNPSSTEEVLYSNLEELIIIDMDKLNAIWKSQEALSLNSFSKLKKIEARDCPELIFLCQILSNTQSLEALIIDNCKYLQLIYGDTIPGTSTPHMHAGGFERLRFLFSASVVKCLDKLRNLEIRKCSLMEGMTKIEDDTPSGMVMFPNLEEMIIIDVDNLNAICHWQQLLSPDSFGKLKKIETRNCPELIFPCQILSNTEILETLIINDCKYLKQISGDLIPETSNSQMNVRGSDWPRVLFPASLTKNMYKLQNLDIRNCSMVEEIITIQENAAPFVEKVIFPNLEEVIIIDVDKLNAIWHWQNALPPNSFGKLKKIEIRNCPELIFPSQMLSNTLSLETLKINNCKYLQQISGDIIPETSNSQMHVGGSERLHVLLPTSVAKNLYKLQILEIKKCSMVEVIIMTEINTPPPVSEKVDIFPNLEEMVIVDVDMLNMIVDSKQQLSSNSFDRLKKIEIRNCPELTSILPCYKRSTIQNLETFTIIDCKSLLEIFPLPGTNTRETCGRTVNCTENLHNLADLPAAMHVEGCERLKYLFPPSAEEGLGKFQKIVIEKCSVMEEIVMVEESSHCSLLEEVKWQSHKSLCNLRSLRIANCENFSKVLPFNVLKSLIVLEELEIQNCQSAEVVFDLEGINTEKVNNMQGIRLEKLILESLPKLKHVWSKTPEEVVTFHELKVLRACGCPCLTSLFPANIGKSLKKLKELTISDCGLEEIVEKEEGQTLSINFQFRKLHSLEISDVPKLKSFYPGEYTTYWPAVKRIHVCIPSEVSVFGTKLFKKHQKHNLDISNQQPIFLVERINTDLEELALNRVDMPLGFLAIFPQLRNLCIQFIDDDHANFPYQWLESIANLRKLTVKSSSFKEIFPSENSEEQIGNDVQLNELSLQFLSQLECICKEGYVAETILSVLGSLYVVECHCLKNLVPSSVCFSHLTHLEVHKCVGLFYLVTSTTAKSLIKLRTLKITECAMIKEIVADDVDNAEQEIVFADLELLELRMLSSLGSFCLKNHTFKFPSLNKLVVSECPQMKMFCLGDLTTPLLARVLMTMDDEGRWEGDLNTTIK